MQRMVLAADEKRYIALPTTRESRIDRQLALSPAGAYAISPGKDGIVSVNGQCLKPFVVASIEGLRFMLLEGAERRLSRFQQPQVRIGGQPECEIAIENARSAATIQGMELHVLSGVAYVNGRRSPQHQALVENDQVLIDGLLLTVRSGELSCWGQGYATTLRPRPEALVDRESFPIYSRSPRIIKNPPTDKVEVQSPPEKTPKRRGRLARLILPPLLMLCLTVVVGVLSHRGSYVLVSAAGMAMTAVFSITTYFGDQKDAREEEFQRVRTYKNYLLSIRKRLYALAQQDREALTYNNPSTIQIARMVDQYSSRIYERAASDGDFLCASLGTADMAPSYRLTFRANELKGDTDPLEQEARGVVTQFETLRDMPVQIDLKNAHLGLVGGKAEIHAVIKALLAQLCFFHSYHDLEIVTLLEGADYSEFEWIRWLPHCKVRNINISGLITTENQRDQVLGNIAQILKARKAKTEESKKEGNYLPHFLFIIDNPKLIINHSIMEYLLQPGGSLGFSLIYTSHMQSNLPENIQTILRLDGSRSATLVMNEGRYVNRPVAIPAVDGVDWERMARQLYPLVHNQGVTTQIPESITFFDLYHVRRPDQIPIAQLWAQNASYKSLAVPLGVRAKDDIVFLNLHEKAHGPHGLVAGTTGSGKSELLQSYILSLALNFHPYEVGFLLIDYKGGGMANLFQGLPHLLGTITNLDGSESLRALASIKSELARRQRIFNEAGVNNINQYTKKFKAGAVSTPLPHLFLISDEFAELKKEQPDFMSELVSTARIGRSLGVHLILATQKPSGVVDDQIWSNSRFKLALKVQNESDSNEVLKTPDAARITQTGRAYLQVGNNEIYELFQSAWSGAEYIEKETKQTFDGRVYLLNALGQGELLNQDLSSLEAGGSTPITQLDATVAEIGRVYASLHAQTVARPWLPPLPERLASPEIEKTLPNIPDCGARRDCNLSAAIGVVDIPERQEQVNYRHDFAQDGNFAVFGASGFGKSTVEMTVALTLALQNSPERLHFYVLDLGNAALSQLRGLPHTADYLSFDDGEKLQKLTKLLSEEMRRRKKLFAAQNALNFAMYNEEAPQPLPAIVLLIDNYDVVKEISLDLEEFFTRLTRDGPGIGLYTMITATRANAVRYAVLNNFKHRIAQYMFDTTDMTSIVGRSKYKLPEIRGRALVKLQDVCVMQCYLPLLSQDDMDYAKRIGRLIEEIGRHNTGQAAPEIKMLPEVLSYSQMVKGAQVRPGQAPIGWDTENVETQYLDLTVPLQLIVGGPQSGKTNLLWLIRRGGGARRLFVADSRERDLQDLRGKSGITYLSDAGHLEEFLSALSSCAMEREIAFRDRGHGARPRDFYATLPTDLVLLDDADHFVELCGKQEKEAGDALRRATECGISLIATSLPGKLRGYDSVTKLLKGAQDGIVLGNPDDQSLLAFRAPRGYKQQVDMGFLYRRGSATLVKLPRAVNEEEV